jgi:hypothetical protein
MNALNIERIHRRSAMNPPRVNKLPGIPAASIKDGHLLLDVVSWGGRSFNCDPRHVGYNFSHGNDALAQVTKVDTTPGLLYDSLDPDNKLGLKGRKEPGLVLGRFPGQPGKPTKKIEWSAIPDDKIPSLLGGRLARLSSSLGAERGLENIIAARGSGNDVIVTHVSEGADRRFIEINEDGWKTDHPERQALIAELDRLPVTDCERMKLSDDGKVLLLFSRVHGPNDQPVVYRVDASSLNLQASKMYRDSEDKKFSVRIIVPDERIDFECLQRSHVTTFVNEWLEHTDAAVVRGSHDKDYNLKLAIEPKNGSRKVTIEGRSISQIKEHDNYKKLDKQTKRAVIRALYKTYGLDNFEREQVDKLRPRYVLQFYRFRETKLKGVLAKPLEKGESVVVTKAVSSAEVAFINEENGCAKGERAIVPLPFQLPEHCRLDPRPYALHGTRFVDPVGTALAPQHLIDPYVMGTEIMAAVWPKVDQLGFFGVMMLTAMAFPHGSVFTDPAKNPWFVRYFAGISHSIFDSKSDAGKHYYWLTGNPTLDGMLESVGAAIVTGPNTDAVNPAREGHLFYSRIPGKRPYMYKTIMPGFYISVVEDAQVSYMDMTMFGFRTDTTILALSAGGGLDNYQTAWTVQRSQRWNGGKCLLMWDGAAEMALDMMRATRFYQGLFNMTRNEESGLYESTVTDLLTSARRDGLSRTQPDTPAQKALVDKTFDVARPLHPKFKPNEARETINVGTWYWVPTFAKMALYLSVPAMIILTVLPLSVSGAMTLVACLAVTMIAWPFWAIQMMKVGVHPKGILSLNPIHLVWGDMPMRTGLKSGLDIQRMGVGKFRISDRTKGNRLPSKDKRVAYWVSGVLPTYAGAVLTVGAVAVTMAVGLGPIALAAAPFVVGYAISSGLSRLVKRWLPNEHTQTFWKSAVRWGVSIAPLTAGITVSCFAFGMGAVLAIPVVTAAMAGGWSLFNGVNIMRAFKRYFKEQRDSYARPAPNPLPLNIPRHFADNARNLRREALGKGSPLYEAEEFTVAGINPYPLWGEIYSSYPQLLSSWGQGQVLENFNSLVGGEKGQTADGLIADLSVEMRSARPTFWQAIKAGTNGGKWHDLINLLDCGSRRRKIGKLERETEQVRFNLRENVELDPQRPARYRIRCNKLEPEMYDRHCELNRLVLEEIYGPASPRKDL